MKRYERQLREWRNTLQTARRDTDAFRAVHDEIVSFRRARRSEGWELRLGALDVQIKGFRGDDAMRVGFRRMVLMVGEGGEVRFHTGSANHIQLDEELGVQLRQIPPSEPLDTHYLWYRRMEGVIELAGADSEPEGALDRLKDYVERHKSDLVRAMFRLY